MKDISIMLCLFSIVFMIGSIILLIRFKDRHELFFRVLISVGQVIGIIGCLIYFTR